MGLQLIFVVETNKKCDSDWIYIKDTIEQFYSYNQTEVKLSRVYMGGKGRYQKKEKEVKSLKTQYSVTAKTNQTEVFFCFDLDDYDRKPEDKIFLRDVEKYCNDRAYHLIWFCRDIERVYIGRKVEDSQKNKVATNFNAKRLITQIDDKKLNNCHYQENTSNIMRELDVYLTRKR